MRRVLFLLAMSLTLLVHAQESRQTSVTCKVFNGTGSGIFLYKIENGEAVSLGFRRPVAGNDTCVFLVPLKKEAIYYLRKATLHSSEFKNAIYLKPGDQKWVNYYFDKTGTSDSVVVVEPNKETTCLQNWVNRFRTVYDMGSNRRNRDEFLASYSKLEQYASFSRINEVPANRYFSQLLAAKMEGDIQYLKASAFFYNAGRMISDYDTAFEHKAFYQSLGSQKFCDARILQSEHGLDLVKFTHGYQMFQKYGTREKMQYQIMSGDLFVANAKAICNETVRIAYVLNRMQQITNYETFKRDVQPFKNLLVSPQYKHIYEKKEDELTIYKKGAAAYNFSLADAKDKLVSLSDFKGKVVVVDVWAMWCAPCLQEKPFFQKIEEEFKDRDDIIFVSVSHDGLPKKEAWINFIAKKGWNGIELLANYNESIGKYYKIEGIPRFMIFDKNGKIVTVDAPRPSNPEFKMIIDQTLKASERATYP